ncbi:MAG: DUF7467 domain-containing protein, partial [Planctomycetota bacterium]
ADESEGGRCPLLILRRYRATDACGNSAECTQSIVVDDVTPPVIEGCPTEPVEIECDTPYELELSVSDNCPDPMRLMCTATFTEGTGVFAPSSSGGTVTLDGPAAVAEIECTVMDACFNASEPCIVTVQCTEVCEVTLEAEACVVPPPPPPPGDACDGKLTSLTLRYTGLGCDATWHSQDPGKVICTGDAGMTEPVDIIITDKDGNETYGTFYDVLLGEDVTATAAFAGEDHFDSNSRAQIFTSGGMLLESVQFHTSCSQPLGPGDQFGSMLVVAMTSTNGGSVELPGDGPDDECITSFTPTPAVCDGKLLVLELQYTGDDCGATSHAQDPGKVDCDDFGPLPAVAHIVVTDKDGNKVYADVSGVAIGDVVTATASNAGEDDFTSDSKVWIYDESGELAQSVKFHTSCSQPLAPGNQFGGVLVVGLVSTEGGASTMSAEVDYRYTVTTPPDSAPFTILSLDDDFGQVPPPPGYAYPFEIPGGSMLVFERTAVISATTVNEVVLTSDPEICSASASTTITVNPPPEDCCASGHKPAALTMTYTGDGCEATMHAQDPGKVECTDYAPLTDVVWIIANEKSNPDDGKIWFEGQVALGEPYVISAAAAGEDELKSNTWIHIFDLDGEYLQRVKFHTSCSQPLFAGDQFGASMVAECAGDAPPSDSCCDFGKPRQLHMTFTGDDCMATSHQQDPGKVECDDLGPIPGLAWILATEKDDPSDDGAKVWFEGLVAVGDVFVLDAANAGEDKLKSNTWIHVFDESGTELRQQIKFHTSCSQPLNVGDQFGSCLLTECVGEDEMPSPLTAPAPGDVTGDRMVDVNDLLAVLAAWGDCDPTQKRCQADLTRDGRVDVQDLLEVVLHWGPRVTD